MLQSNSNGASVRLGVMGCSAFAIRSMIPALRESEGIQLAAIASRDPKKGRDTADRFDCDISCSYDDLINSSEIDAIYMPLPTGLHEKWIHRALDTGKHLLVEKSLACDYESTLRIVEHARSAGVLIIENFLFLRHRQTTWIKQQIADGTVGELRFFRAAFTIPPLDPENFRYNDPIGGGALLDLGSYMVRSTLAFLGEGVELVEATIEHSLSRSIDARGSATFRDSSGLVSQTLWGFDTHYQCSWEFLGTEGRILCSRALTSPPGFEAPVRLERNREAEEIKIPPDNHYLNQWNFFTSSIRNPEIIGTSLEECLTQAGLMEEIRRRGLRKSAS